MASFASVNANSLVESDVAATAISGGIVIYSFFGSGSPANPRGLGLADMLDKIQGLTLNSDGSIQDILSVVCTAFTGAVTANVSLNWKENY